MCMLDRTFWYEYFSREVLGLFQNYIAFNTESKKKFPFWSFSRRRKKDQETTATEKTGYFRGVRDKVLSTFGGLIFVRT